MTSADDGLAATSPSPPTGRRAVLEEQQGSSRVAAPRPVRRTKWLLAALLLAIVAIYWFWPRPIRIPLRDGRTLEIAAITTGVKHSHPVPMSWRSVRNQFTAKSPYRPIQTYITHQPAIVLWLDDPMLFGQYQFVLIDRHGRRSTMIRGKVCNDGCLWAFPLIEEDQVLQVEVVNEAKELVGSGTIPFSR